MLTTKIINDKVITNEIDSFDVEYYKILEETLVEWSSKEDDEAYNDL